MFSSVDGDDDGVDDDVGEVLNFGICWQSSSIFLYTE